jgi:hypothetical protein
MYLLGGIMKTLFLTLLIALSFNVHADEIRLAIITSEFDKNVTDYYVITDDQGHVDSMRYVTTLPNGGIMEDVTLPAERVIKEGAVLVERNGHQAVRLEVENFSVITGGTIRLNYLFSGVTGARHIKRLNLKLQDRFRIYDADKEVNRLFLEANWSRIFGIVGVRSIQTSFSQETGPLF